MQNGEKRVCDYSKITSIGKNYEKHIAPARIRSDNIPYSQNMCEGAKEWDLFNQEERKKIYNQLADEHMKNRIMLTNFVIKQYKVDDLPMSTVEQDLYCNGISDKDIKWEVGNVELAAGDMRKRGLHRMNPILIDATKKGVVIANGNHRVQALRNMMRNGEIPKNFMVPTIMICQK